MKKLTIIAVCLFLFGCKAETTPLEIADISSDNNHYEECTVYVKSQSKTPLDFGFYITETSLYTSIPQLEKNSVSHSIYGLETDICQPFPLKDVLEIYKNGKTPLITIYSSNTCLPDAYELLKVSQTYGALNIPIYINLLPFSHTLWEDMDAYKNFWEQAAKNFKYNAKNATLIWSVFKEDTPFYEKAMPKSELFSYGGLMFYGNSTDGPNEFLSSLEALYNVTEKEIIISALGISNYSTSDHVYKTQEAMSSIENLYWEVYTSHPKVLALIYMDKDLTTLSPTATLCNNYRITGEKSILESYSHVINSIKENTDTYHKSPYKGKISNGTVFINEELFSYHNLPLEKPAQKDYSPQNFISEHDLKNYEIYEKNGEIYLSLL